MKKAFTMIELLVVMAIMGILTIITVSQFTTAKIKARDAQRKADLSSVSKALLMYYADYSKFPDGLDLVSGVGFTDVTGYIYMKELPKENTNKTECPYKYLVSADRSQYAVLGCLENKEDKDAWTKGMTPALREINCGMTYRYNFGFVSPNISLDSDAGGCSL